MKSINAIGVEDGKIPNKKNDEVYLTNEEFKSFKSSNIRKYTLSNSNYMFAQWVWILFSIYQKVKLGTVVDVKIVLENQLRWLVRNISTLNRNNICGHYSNVIDIHSKCDRIEKEIEKLMGSKKRIHLYEYFNAYPKKKSNFLGVLSEISLMIYKNEKYEFLHELNTFGKIKKKILQINGYEKNEQEGLLLDLLLNSEIVLSDKQVCSNKEQAEYDEFKYVLGNSRVHITTNEIYKTIDSQFGVNKRWKIIDIINYQILNNVQDVVFGIDKKLNIVSIHVDEFNQNGIFDFNVVDVKKKRNCSKTNINLLSTPLKRKISEISSNSDDHCSMKEYDIYDCIEMPFINMDEIFINFTFQNRFEV